MTDIPARIMEEAKDVVRSLGLYFEGDGYIALTRRDIRKIATALLAAEQRARKEALEEAAQVAENEPEFEGYPLPHVVEAMIAIGPVGNARSACRATKQSIAAAIRALANEKEG